MEALRAPRAQLHRQQRWITCAAIAAIGVTVVALLLSFAGGTGSSQIRSSGLITFDAADKSTSSLIARHVVKLKEARDKFVSNFWSWDSPFDEVEEEMRGAYGQDPGQPGSWRDPGGYWDENAQVWVPTASSGYWDEHADAWVEPAENWEATAMYQSLHQDQAAWQEAVPGGEGQQWQQPAEGHEQQGGQAQDAREWQLPPETQAEAWAGNEWAEPTKLWASEAESWPTAEAEGTNVHVGGEGAAVVAEPGSWDQGAREVASAVWDSTDEGWRAAGEDGKPQPAKDTDAEPGAQQWQEGAASAEVWPGPEGSERWSEDASQDWQEQAGWVEPESADASLDTGEQPEVDSGEPAVWVDDVE